jgi:hypothetical protein
MLKFMIGEKTQYKQARPMKQAVVAARQLFLIGLAPAMFSL